MHTDDQAAGAGTFRLLLASSFHAGKSTLINALAGQGLCPMGRSTPEGAVRRVLLRSGPGAARSESGREGEGAFSSPVFRRDLLLLETPGGNTPHRALAERTLEEGGYEAAIYVLNAEQIGTQEDQGHLRRVAKHLGSRPVLFVLNKVDRLDPEDGPLPEILEGIREDLCHAGFPDSPLCPLSARAAYLDRKRGERSRQETRDWNNLRESFRERDLSLWYRDKAGREGIWRERTLRLLPQALRLPGMDRGGKLLSQCGFFGFEMLLCKMLQAGAPEF